MHAKIFEFTLLFYWLLTFIFQCDTIPNDRKHFLPLRSPYFEQLQSAIGID